MSRFFSWIILLTACLWTIACSACNQSNKPVHDPIRVWAASSLTAPLTELGQIWTREGHTTEIELISGSSQNLVFQLNQGAPGDVLATADYLQVERGLAAGLIRAEDVIKIAGNSLTLVVHPQAAQEVKNLAGLAQPGLRIAWARDGVPLAVYSQQLLTSWASKHGDETYMDRVRDNILSFDANAHSVRNRLLQGEADAALLYTSDALALRTQLQIFPIDPYVNVKTALYAVPLQKTQQPTEVRAFMDFLAGPHSRAVFLAHGFETDGIE